MRRLGLSVALIFAACGPEPITQPPKHRASEALRACAAVSAPVTSIATGVEKLNALPPPVDGPCFLASLPRPLTLVATSGVTSAQPAASRASPRLFIMLEGVVASLVPEGDGSKLLEFGEWVTPVRTLKGEVALPVIEPLAADAPFKHVLYSQPATTCALCHRMEEPHPTIPGAYVSAAFKPQKGTTVGVAELQVHHDQCVADGDEQGRCAMFHALFDFGTVKDGAFAKEVETFVQ
ncbi:MAG: hypothetical protein ACOZQL_33065 [Myxococcota bacterium]